MSLEHNTKIRCQKCNHEFEVGTDTKDYLDYPLEDYLDMKNHLLDCFLKLYKDDECQIDYHKILDFYNSLKDKK